jgi:hypothetical protein
MQYLLPCPCGRQIVVEPRQAGQTIPCACGNVVLAPTLLDMTMLERAPVSPSLERPTSTWDLRHRLLLLGIVLLLVAVVGGIWLFMARPVSRFAAIDPEQVRQNAKNLTPSETWGTWEMMQQGLDRRIDQDYAAAVLRYRVWQVVVGVVALAGAALTIAGAIRGKPR